mgnify:CR=1 FL=1
MKFFSLQYSRSVFSVLIATIILLENYSASQTVASPDVVDLPFGDINVLVLTDTHSWVGGHSTNEPQHNADYGDILSFYQRLHAHCQRHNMDLWFVVNGDWIDGTGLSLNNDISYLTPILEHMPWDAVNVGNHELERSEVVDQFMRPGGFVEVSPAMGSSVASVINYWDGFESAFKVSYLY